MNMPHKSVKTFKISLLSAVVFATVSLTTPTQAHAACTIDPVGGGRVVGAAQNTGGNIASQTMLNCFYQETVNWLDKIYVYITTGQTHSGPDQGKGIIGLLEAINQQQNNQRDYDKELSANDTQQQQRLMVEAAMAQKLVNNHPSPRDCMEAPNRMAARAGASGAISRVAKAAIEAKVEVESTKRTDLEHLASVYVGRVEKGYCSPTDVEVMVSGKAQKRNAFNCTAPGAMPDADARVQTLFTPAHDYTNPETAAKVSLTYNKGKVDANGKPMDMTGSKEDQYQAALDSISNLAARYNPPVLSPESENTANGRAYLARLKTYQARVSTGTNVLTTIASMRTPGAGTLSPAMAKQVWGGVSDGGQLEDTKTVYKRIFGEQVEFPELPSEAELMRYEVLRRYADKDPDKSWDSKLRGDNAPIEVARTLAVTNFLLYQIHSRVEEGNAVEAVSLLHQINPLTREQMEAAARNVQSLR